MQIPNLEILTHPNIPKPLHGLNPRTILGDTWWNRQRQTAYAASNYHCWACGTHKTAAKYHKWLEAHEMYTYDYENGVAHFQYVVALCHSCHNFIHSGRLYAMYKKGQEPLYKVKDILSTGIGRLQHYGLQPYFGTFVVWLMLEQDMSEKEAYAHAAKFYPPTPKSSVRWEEWRLELNGVLYKPLYRNEKEWERKYGR